MTTQNLDFAGDPISSRYSFNGRDMEYAGADSDFECTGLGERVASVVACGLLAVAGLSLIARGHPIAGAIFGAAGGGLAYRNATRHFPAYQRPGATDQDAVAPRTEEFSSQASVAVNRSPSIPRAGERPNPTR